MVQTFNCPSCSAPIEHPGSEPTTICPFCNNRVEVPEAIFKANEEIQTQQAASKWLKVTFIIVALAVVIPTCLGLGITVVGLVFAFLGPLVGIAVPFLIHH